MCVVALNGEKLKINKNISPSKTQDEIFSQDNVKDDLKSTDIDKEKLLNKQ